MRKHLLKVHVSWKNDRTFYVETDAEMTPTEIENYVALLKSMVERAVTEYNEYGNVDDNALYDFIAQGVDALFPLPPQSQSSVSNEGQPFDVAIEWNANDSAFNAWKFPQ